MYWCGLGEAIMKQILAVVATLAGTYPAMAQNVIPQWNSISSIGAGWLSTAQVAKTRSSGGARQLPFPITSAAADHSPAVGAIS
jgi:hypothetical protein